MGSNVCMNAAGLRRVRRGEHKGGGVKSPPLRGGVRGGVKQRNRWLRLYRSSQHTATHNMDDESC